MINKIIAIKNSKIETPDIYIIKAKNNNKIMGVLIKWLGVTRRRTNSGKNLWDSWYLISKKMLKYQMFDSNFDFTGNDIVKLGKRNGFTDYIQFKGYIVCKWENKEVLDNYKVDIDKFYQKELAFWKKSDGWLYTDPKEY